MGNKLAVAAFGLYLVEVFADSVDTFRVADGDYVERKFFGKQVKVINGASAVEDKFGGCDREHLWYVFKGEAIKNGRVVKMDFSERMRYISFALLKRSCGRVARLSSAKASTAVRIRSGPHLLKEKALNQLIVAPFFICRKSAI